MAKRQIGTVLGLIGLLLVLTGPALADRERDEARKRQKAWEEAQAAFKTEFRSEDHAARKAAVLKLLPFSDLGAAKFVVENVFGRETHPGVLEAAFGVIARTTDPQMVSWLVGKATGRAGWEIRAPLVEALGNIENKAADEALLTLLEKEEDPRVLSMTLFGIAKKKLEAALGDVIGLLEADDWQVRVAAIEALVALGHDRAIEPLIDRLMNERGRLRQDLADALKELTGKSFGTDANAWRKWYHERDPDAPPDEPPPPDPAGAASAVDEPTYFGIKVISERILFVLDISRSMRTPIDIDKMKLARESASTGADGDPENKDDEKFEETIEWWKIKDRLDLAKAQLKFVIKNLGKKQEFEIVVFSDSVHAWNGGRLMGASPRAKAKAVQFIDQVEVQGATAFGDALDFSFEMAGAGSYDKNYRSGVDTIFVLSDGAPSDRPEDEILESVRHRNRLRKIKVHVIAIMNYSVRFLRLLAEQNGGAYKFFKVEDRQ